MASFFPMRRAERRALFGLAAFSAAAFVPALAGFSFLGVSLFGWLMALLLFGSPLLLLTLLRPETPNAPGTPTNRYDSDSAPPGASADRADSATADTAPARRPSAADRSRSAADRTPPR